MDVLIHVLEVVLPARSAQVPIIIIERFLVTVNWSDHGKTSNIEFPVFVEGRILNIFLDNESTRALVAFRADDLLDLIQLRLDCDAYSSISVLTWLYDPNILELFQLECLFVLCLHLIKFDLVLHKLIL